MSVFVFLVILYLLSSERQHTGSALLASGVIWWINEEQGERGQWVIFWSHTGCLQLWKPGNLGEFVNKPNAHSSAHAWVKGHGSLVM